MSVCYFLFFLLFFIILLGLAAIIGMLVVSHQLDKEIERKLNGD